MEMSSQIGVLTLSILLLVSFVHTQQDSQTGIDLKKELDELKSLAKNSIIQNFTENDQSMSFLTNFVDQIKLHCKEKNPNGDFDFDQKELGDNIKMCMEEKFANNTVDTVFNEIEESIPEGELDKVFSEMCTVKWPAIHSCLRKTFDLMDKCWPELHLETLLTQSVKFFCGEDNDGARIALFIAEGGLKCVETHSEEVRMCVEHYRPKDLEIDPEGEAFDAVEDFLKNHKPEDTKKSLCYGLRDAHKCVGVLKRCADPTPENLISSMLRQTAYAVQCPPEDFYVEASAVNLVKKISILTPLILTTFSLIS